LLNPPEKIALLNAEDICEQEDRNDIEYDESDEKTEIPPVMVVLDIEAVTEESVGGAVLAVLTVSGGVGVGDVASVVGDICRQEGLAGLTRWRIDWHELPVRTVDVITTDCLTDKTFDNVSEGRQTVHPFPPPELLVRLEDAIECNDEREEEAEQQTRNLRIWRHGGDSLTDSGVVQREHDAKHQVSVPPTTDGKAYGPEPAQEEEGGSQDVPRDIRGDLRRHQGRPAVHSAGSFPNFIHVAHVDERYLKLIGRGDSNDGGHEDREELVLRSLDAVLRLEESETNEKPRDDIEGNLRDDIGRISPVRLAVASEQGSDLVEPRGSELALVGGLDWGTTAAFSVNLLNLVLHALSLI